ncbi:MULTISPECIES: DNA-binding domain-containing protein [Polaromonas]|uniref:DNA-binding domain-containing protein n=1 Tax=Polaromonas aquatica TaxID=332657 RepID=A0ABW1U3G6_9BURK
MDELRPSDWIAQCAERLHDRWHTVKTAELEEVAVDIWKNDYLRSMDPADAAAF